MITFMGWVVGNLFAWHYFNLNLGQTVGVMVLTLICTPKDWTKDW